MSRDLTIEVQQHLSAHPSGRSVVEIGLALRVRTATVRDLLRGNPLFEALEVGDAPHVRTVYRNRSVDRDRLGRPTVTHAGLILDALREGPKSAAELYQFGGVVHSRIADLRRAGHQISCVRVKGEEGAAAYRYTLDVDAHPPVKPRTPAFACPNCLTEHAEAFCPTCGRTLAA